MLCKTPPAVTRWAVFFMPIGYLCQWIFYAVFAAVSACCVPVSHADVLARSAFQAVCAVL